MLVAGGIGHIDQWSSSKNKETPSVRDWRGENERIWHLTELWPLKNDRMAKVAVS